jgi:hypothetical protein
MDGGAALLALAVGAQLCAAVGGEQLPRLARPAALALVCVPGGLFVLAFLFFFG